MTRLRTRWIYLIVSVAVALAIGWGFVPKPISVETTAVVRGPMVVTVDEEARTRVRERYTVSAPVMGYLTRIAFRPGAVVQPGQSVARVLPVPSTPIDARTRSQLQARVEAAVDASRQARTRVESARAAFGQATRELDR